MVAVCAFEDVKVPAAAADQQQSLCCLCPAVGAPLLPCCCARPPVLHRLFAPCGWGGRVSRGNQLAARGAVHTLQTSRAQRPFCCR